MSLGTSYSVRLESWGLVHMGLVADPEFGNGIFRYIDAINELVPTRNAVHDSFGMSVADIDAKLRAYLAHEKFKVSTLTYESLPVTPLGPDACWAGAKPANGWPTRCSTSG